MFLIDFDIFAEALFSGKTDDEDDNVVNLLRKMMLLSVMFILIASHSLNAVTEKQFLQLSNDIITVLPWQM